MTEFSETARPEQPSPTADADAPLPPAAPKLYDPTRNKKWGVATIEETQTEFDGNQEALAARIRDDKDRRHKKTWEDAVERASEGVRMKVFKASLTGTGRATELMVHKTGYKAPTTQQRIHLGEYFPWAAPELQIWMERSRVEREPGEGVDDFDMPSDRIIIEMGKEAAKKAGCWGVPQIIMVTSNGVEAADLPRNIGWKEGRKSPYPWWEDKGALTHPWQDSHLVMERLEPSQQKDPQPEWSCDLFVRNGEPVVLRGRGFVARSDGRALLGSADALNQFQPHVSFATQKTKDLTVPGDRTGRRHLILDEIAIKLGITPSALVEHLRNRGYLNLQGEVTPAALDAGITTIVDGGTQFCFDAIKKIVDEPKAEQIAADNPGGQDLPTEVDATEETTDIVVTDQPGEQDAPTAETDQADETLDVGATDKPGERDAPKVKTAQADGTTDLAAVSETEEAEEATGATDRAQRVTVWQGGGMRRVTAQQKDRSFADGEMDKPRTEPVRDETSSGSVDDTALARRATEQLEGAMEALLTAQEAMCRRTEEGEFVPHPGDNETLRSRIKMGAEALARVHAILTNSMPVYRTLLKSVDTLTMQAQRSEAETAELKRRVHDGLAKIADLENGSAGYAEVIPLPASPDIGDHPAAAASH